ncbi:hypothetical protein J14TS2_39080 [Bacillus sp. J14TS2]|uniref:hypothetical protein n=1 Tax=Bacillus sp. J14TS2 TaxID=2807188 RepID=UPI001B231DBB|nr:hypothetical protein [Bacillus sp. J14TS2]GIN73433.1 hypothetical protein J14TS2_39080 [Bacillus sp. J14TS2]
MNQKSGKKAGKRFIERVYGPKMRVKSRQVVHRSVYASKNRLKSGKMVRRVVYAPKTG